MTFRAVRRGDENIHLVYARPWELPDILDANGAIDYSKVAQLGIEIDEIVVRIRVI